MPSLANPLPCMLLVMACALAGCADDGPPSPPAVGVTTGEGPQIDCTPGEALGCQCTDGRAGTQRCADNGAELSRCMCDDMPPGNDDTGSDTGAESSGSDDTGAAMCGNGVVDEGEQCDDGNRQPDDACSNACIEPCGLIWDVTDGRPDSGTFIQSAATGPDGTTAVIGTIPTDTGSEIWIGSYDAEGAERFAMSRAVSDVDAGVAVAVDADGRTLAVSTVDAGGQTDIDVVLLAADGRIVWNETLAGADGGDDTAGGATFDADGNAVVTGTTRVAEGDSDLWVAKFSGDGTAQWESTFSGAGNGNFSLDQGGPVATDAEGNIYAQAGVYVDFDERDVHLVKFAPSGGEALWDVAPYAGGTVQEHGPAGVGIDTQGNVVMGMANLSGSLSWAFWAAKFDAEGTEIWRTDHTTLGYESPTTLNGLGVSEDGRVSLSVSEAPLKGDLLVSVASLLPDGSLGCQAVMERDGAFFLGAGGTASSNGDVVATGLVSVDGTTQQRWAARFRGAALAGR